MSVKTKQPLNLPKQSLNLPKEPLNLPKEPDPRVLKKPTPDFDETGTVKVVGYIGEMTDEFVNLHHLFDHRAYYQIPREGIAACNPVDSSHAENLHELELYEKTPISYYHATTVDMTAAALAHASDTFSRHGKKTKAIQTEIRCAANCPNCINGVCFPANFPLGAGHSEMFGMTVSSPSNQE